MALLRSAIWVVLRAINITLLRSEEMTFARGSKACRITWIVSLIEQRLQAKEPLAKVTTNGKGIEIQNKLA